MFCPISFNYCFKIISLQNFFYKRISNIHSMAPQTRSQRMMNPYLAHPKKRPRTPTPTLSPPELPQSPSVPTTTLPFINDQQCPPSPFLSPTSLHVPASPPLKTIKKIRQKKNQKSKKSTQIYIYIYINK